MELQTFDLTFEGLQWSIFLSKIGLLVHNSYVCHVLHLHDEQFNSTRDPRNRKNGHLVLAYDVVGKILGKLGKFCLM